MKFKIGDVVVLKSGGQDMTISEIGEKTDTKPLKDIGTIPIDKLLNEFPKKGNGTDLPEGRVKCKWFLKSGKLENAEFHVDEIGLTSSQKK
jgi:uncharacterized protein YodC (DUF2158 family)